MRRPQTAALVAAVFAALSAVYLYLGGPQTETLTSKGFDLEPSTRGPAPPPSQLPSSSSLNPGLRAGYAAAPAGVTPPASRPAQTGTDDPTPAGAAAGQAPPQPAEPAAAARPDAEATPAEAGKAGLPVGASALAKAGATNGLLAPMRDMLLKQPKLLRYLANNKTFVDAFFKRELAQKHCSDGKALASYLANGSAKGGVSEETGLLQSLLAHPAAAKAVGDTEFANRVLACPSVTALINDRAAVTMIAVSNPQLLTLAMNPTALAALSGNPLAHERLMQVQQSLGGSIR